MFPTCHKSPYIHFADNDVAQSSANTERGVESSQRRALPPALKRKLFHATGELMTPSLEHGYILLWLVECLLVGVGVGVGVAAYTVCMN